MAERDFTNETLAIIRKNVDENSDSFGDVFDNIWYTILGYWNSSDIQEKTDSIEEYYRILCEINNFTKQRLAEIVADVHEIEDKYTEVCRAETQNLTDYSAMLGHLIDSVSADDFDLSFDAGAFLLLYGNYDEYMSDQEWKEWIMEQFGFDAETAEIMLLIKKALDEKYPSSEYGEGYADWLFARILGGMSDSYRGFNWDQTAGELPFDPSEEGIRQFLKEQCGVSDSDLDYLWYKVRVQQQIASDPEGYDPDDLEKNPDKIAEFKSKMEKALGRELTDEEFMELWREQYEAFHDKPDFAHQMITTAALLAGPLGKAGWLADLGTGGMREESAGWFGDATIWGDDGSPPSFGNDDYCADLDAANIAYYMKKYGLSYGEAMTKYYNDLKSGKSRANIFKEHTNLSFVKIRIAQQLFMHIYGGTTEMSLADAEFFLEQNKAEFPDTYNFIKSLEAGLNEMGSFI